MLFKCSKYCAPAASLTSLLVLPPPQLLSPFRTNKIHLLKKLFPPWAWSIDSALSSMGDVSGSRTEAVPTWEASDHIDKSHQVDLGLLSTYCVLG